MNISYLHDFNDYAKKTNPVFIFGMNRGGTTLTYHVMKFHPQIIKLPQDTYFFRHFWDLRKKIPVKVLYKILLETSEIRSQPKAQPYNNGIKKFLLHHPADLIRRNDPRDIFKFMSYVAYCQQKEEKNDVKWWAEKTNNHIFYYRILRKWFPSSKFIICVRDPRAVAASALGAIGAKKEKGNSPSFVMKYCQNHSFAWLDRAGRALAIKKYFMDDTYISKYEEFVGNPISHINRLWRFLNLPEMNEEELRDKINNLGLIYKSKTGVKRDTGIDTFSIERWREILPPNAQGIIEDITFRTAKKLGYDFGNKKPLLRFSYIGKMPQETFLDYPKRMLSLIPTLMRRIASLCIR